MDFSLNIKPELKLILTQEMKLSLNILEMSSNDLQKYIKEESFKNPLLEVNFSSKGYNSKDDDSEESSPFDFIAKEKNLIDFLEEQLMYIDLSEEMKSLCNFIINNLDDKGYLSISREEIKKETSFSLKNIDSAIKIIKNLEPVGIGAKDLKECLIIQLTKKNIIDRKLFYLINNFMTELAYKKYDIIKDTLSISENEIEKYLKIIQGLNPIPSRGFYMGDNIRYIEPDAEIKNINGKYTVIMSEKNIPKINIQSFENEDNISSKTKMYFNSATNLIKAIERRQITLEKILNLILEKQYSFFSEPKGKLNSLILKDIASTLEIHESTVSRAIKNKYVLTDRGLIRLKDMFIINNKKIFIKERIEKLILNEDRTSPLHDSEIANILEKENFKIARRTVVKYREELGIEPSHKRKLQNVTS